MRMNLDRRRVVLVSALLLLSAFTVVDMFEDFEEGTGPGHVALEAVITVLAIGGAALEGHAILAHLRRERATSAELRARLDDTRREAERLRRDAEAFKREAGAFVTGLAAAIDAQLEQWGLTGAEKETALLLLKGLSHKEIADVRNVGEATARQQARAIYKKAGLGGRHDLAAFFLEDLLAPPVR
jgi:DNA-binding CsgD family transcriptional regulator